MFGIISLLNKEPGYRLGNINGSLSERWKQDFTVIKRGNKKDMFKMVSSSQRNKIAKQFIKLNSILSLNHIITTLFPDM